MDSDTVVSPLGRTWAVVNQNRPFNNDIARNRSRIVTRRFTVIEMPSRPSPARVSETPRDGAAWFQHETVRDCASLQSGGLRRVGN